MIALVLCSVFTGLFAGVFALVLGAPFTVAILIYVGFGVASIALALVRALICQQISRTKTPMLHPIKMVETQS